MSNFDPIYPIPQAVEDEEVHLFAPILVGQVNSYYCTSRFAKWVALSRKGRELVERYLTRPKRPLQPVDLCAHRAGVFAVVVFGGAVEH